MTGALHIEEVNSRPAVAFQIGETRVAAPAAGIQSHLGGYILKLVVAQIFVQNRMLKTIRVKVAGERISQTDVGAFRAFFIFGVNADIANQQIYQAIVIVIKEE